MWRFDRGSSELLLPAPVQFYVRETLKVSRRRTAHTGKRAVLRVSMLRSVCVRGRIAHGRAGARRAPRSMLNFTDNSMRIKVIWQRQFWAFLEPEPCSGSSSARRFTVNGTAAAGRSGHAGCLAAACSCEGRFGRAEPQNSRTWNIIRNCGGQPGIPRAVLSIHRCGLADWSLQRAPAGIGTPSARPEVRRFLD